jgi:LCP family protein required for cell wall assembly
MIGPMYLRHPRRQPALVAVALSLALITACSNVSSTPTPTPMPTATASPSITPSPSPEPTATLKPTPIPIPVDEERLGRRFTVLVAGLDSTDARRAAGLTPRTDALMVISVSADQSQIALISLPRDTVDVPLATGGVYRGKVNGIADGLGMEALRGAMATLLGVPIDRYIEVDMEDFVWMVDAVGGIDVEVETRISDSKVHLQLDAGPAHLDGATALSYSRTRFDGDYRRAARQQQVMLALAREWLNPGLGALIGTVRLLGSLQTDIALTDITTLLEIGRRSIGAEVTTIVLSPPRFALFVGIEPNSNRGWVMIPNVPAMRAYAQELLVD